jgi:endo-beta-N-acetylglucosaminidase D
MNKKIFFTAALCLVTTTIFSQGLTLTISDLMSWTTSTANPDNVCNTPLHSRDRTGFQIATGLNDRPKVLYCPDGMNNFGPYIDSASQFNLFNFSHWQYIDILAWFGGSASQPIIIPTKAWVDAAHKNGVKVIGTVFMAPTVYGGSQVQVQSLLQQDSSGHFIAAQKLIDIANYYHFDGWIMNFETQVNSTTGALASAFIAQLDSNYTGELIWYDAMLQSGTVSYQNRLDAANSYFFQHSTGLFTNYNWTLTTTVQGSATYATGLGLSPLNVYTGADMWPTRNAQPAFTNYNWIDKIITNNGAFTSIAMFATNFTFNYSGFSNFNNDPTDYANFYAAERKIFSGLDEDPFTVDAQWKGLGNYLPVWTPIMSVPFETDFNTGHGLNYYSNGLISSASPWHNMSKQDILPSWTFYKDSLTIDYDFNDAYSGGSSLSISSATGGAFEIPLYSTLITITPQRLSELITVKSSGTNIDSIGLGYIKGVSTYKSFHTFPSSGNWEDLTSNLNYMVPGDTIFGIKLLVYASGPFTMNLGRINVNDSSTTGIAQANPLNSDFKIFRDFQGEIHAFNNTTVNTKLLIFDLKGSEVYNTAIQKQGTIQFTLPENNSYIYKFLPADSAHKPVTGKLALQ